MNAKMVGLTIIYLTCGNLNVVSQNIINEFETIEFRLRQLSNRTKPYDLCYDETIKKYQFKWSKKQTDSIWLDDLQFKLKHKDNIQLKCLQDYNRTTISLKNKKNNCGFLYDGYLFNLHHQLQVIERDVTKIWFEIDAFRDDCLGAFGYVRTCTHEINYLNDETNQVESTLNQTLSNQVLQKAMICYLKINKRYQRKILLAQTNYFNCTQSVDPL